MTVKTIVATGLVALAALTSAGDARADDLDINNLPTVPDSRVAASVKDIRLPVRDIRLPPAKDLESQTTDGAEQVVTLSADILFTFDESDLSDAAAARIGDLVDGVPNGAAVGIGGHTDSLGSTAYNKKLSAARAKAVADVIGDARPDLDLTVKGFGEADPVAPNTSGGEDDPEGRAKNRRVEIRYTT